MGKIINFEELKERRFRKKYLIYIIYFIIVLYIMYSIFLLVKTPNDTVVVEKGILTLEESANGYIVRDEKVLTGENYKNGLTAIISEGERAAKGETIFRYSSNNEQELKEKIEETNLKIQEALQNSPTIFSTDIKNLEKQIDDKVQILNSITDIQEINEYKKDIEELTTKKAKIAGTLSSSGSYIQELTNQKESYEKELTESSEYITAPISGVVSYKVDGFEDVLNSNDFSNLTEENLSNLEIKTGKIISTSTESGKIVNNFDCYLAAVLDSEAALNAKIGDDVTITLSSGKEINSEISYIAKQENGKVIIVFDLKTLTQELLNYRRISFNITWWSYSGLKVPNSSIIEDDKGMKYVVRKKTTGEQKILVKLLKKNDKYSIIGTYTTEELQNLGIDVKSYSRILQYDSILQYPTN